MSLIYSVNLFSYSYNLFTIFHNLLNYVHFDLWPHSYFYPYAFVTWCFGMTSSLSQHKRCVISHLSSCHQTVNMCHKASTHWHKFCWIITQIQDCSRWLPAWGSKSIVFCFCTSLSSKCLSIYNHHLLPTGFLFTDILIWPAGTFLFSVFVLLASTHLRLS